MIRDSRRGFEFSRLNSLSLAFSRKDKKIKNHWKNQWICDSRPSEIIMFCTRKMILGARPCTWEIMHVKG